MPNWSTNRITLYEDHNLESDGFYNDKDGNYNIKEIFEEFLKDTEEEVEQDGEKITFHNLMKVMPTPEILKRFTQVAHLISTKIKRLGNI